MRSFATSSIALVATAALTLAACGSDGDADGGGGGAGGDTGGLSGDDAALAAAIAADLVAEDEDGFSEAFDTDCMGVEVVKALGGANAIEDKYGITAATVGDIDETPLDLADAAKVADGYARCGDLKDLFTQSFVSEGQTQEEAECLTADITDDQVKQSIVESLAGQEDGAATSELFNAMFSRVETCGIDF